MARRPKRFFGGEEVESDSNAGMKQAYETSQEERARTPSADYGDYIPQSSSETVKATSKPTSKPAPTPKAESKPAPEPSSVRRLSREEGEAIRKASEASKPASAKTESASTPVSAKKETYRDFSGNIQTKKSTPDRDAESAARRTKVVEAAKSVGSGIGSLFNKAIENYKSTVPRYNKEKKMAKGGTASSRADGIAQRGKTRGTMAAMCGGGMAKGKR